MPTESLTLRILGDSSGLRAELEAALSQLDAFEDHVAALADAGRRVGEGFGGLASAAAPLQQVSQLLSGIFKQMQVIRQTPLTINVQPALASLLKLSAAIDAIALKLRALSAAPAGSPPGAAAGGVNPADKLGALAPAMAAAPAAALATVSNGGAPAALVAPPAATPRVPHGSDVLSPVRAPVPLSIERLALTTSPALSNDRRPRVVEAPPVDPFAFPPRHSRSPQLPAAPELHRADADRTIGPVSTTATTNHFGGITINVRETADVNALVRDLRLQGVQLRHRRG